MRKPVQNMVPTPMPLLTCPGRHYWAPHVRTPYLVFVDESFRGFFEFRERGYFAHAAVGIPESQYDGMTSAVAPVFEEYRRLTSAGQREIVGCEAKRVTGHRVAPEQQLVDGVVGEMLGVVAVGMAAGDAEDPLAEQVRHRVPDLAGFAPVDQTANKPGHQPVYLLGRLQQHGAPVGAAADRTGRAAARTGSGIGRGSIR